MSGKLSFAMPQPGSKAGANAKLAATKGKKTRFQQAKEAAEAKKALEKAEADSLLGEFEKSFSADTGSNGSKAFVPSGGGSIYQPAAKPLSEMERMMLESAQETRGRGAADARAPSTLSELSAVRSQKRREMDAFLEEIKQRQDGGGPLASMSLAEAAAAGNAAGRSSSQDEGDPSSTNLYIGHVAPTVTEERLQTLFAEFGEIYSIKIMWPRTDEERARQRNCGFVSFWRRGDAEAAKQALQSRELDGMCIQIGWGKAINKLAHGIGDETRVKDVPLNALSAALSDPAAASAADAITVLAPVKDSSAEDPANMVNALLASAGLHPNSTIAEGTARQVAEAALAAIQKTRAAQAAAMAAAPQPLASDAPPPEMQEGDPSVTVVEPVSEERRYLIDRTARYVAKDGAALEGSLMQRERSNPAFAFLFEHGSAEGLYYRWKAYSLAMGDRERNWREKPFQMTPGGPFWVPPPMPTVSSDSEEEREKEQQKERERRRKEAREREAAAEKEGTVKDDKYKYTTGKSFVDTCCELSSGSIV
jgi:hypothetical protein